MKGSTRREFLAAVAHGAAAGGAACMLTGCPVPSSPLFTPYTLPARVAAVRGTDLVQMTRDSLDAFGGAGAIVHEGETVFIKPNFGAFGMVKYNPVQAGDAVKPEIVVTVAEECLKAGAAEVIIGEGGQAIQWDWSIVKTLDGTTHLAAEAERLRTAYPHQRVTLACLQADSPAWDAVDSPCTKLDHIYVSSLLTRADRVISIPVLKTHRWTQITAGLKNFVGSTSAQRYGLGVQWRFRLHDAGIEQCFLDIVRALKPDFTIIDGSICCEGNGPHVCPGWWGTTVDLRDRLGSWFMLASPDLAAADATAARIIGFDPYADVKHLRMAYEQGLGQIQEGMIQLDGASVADLQVEWQPAEQTEGFREVLLPGLMLLERCNG